MKEYNDFDCLITLQKFIETHPTLFPLGADEIEELQGKMASAPDTLTDHDWLLLITAEHMDAMWSSFDASDPVNGEKEFYDFIYQRGE